jgi:hypothetical protein
MSLSVGLQRAPRGCSYPQAASDGLASGCAARDCPVVPSSHPSEIRARSRFGSANGAAGVAINPRCAPAEPVR